MKFKEYITKTIRTLPDLHQVYHNQGIAIKAIHYVQLEEPAGVVQFTTDQMLNLVHMRLGIFSEINELIEALHKQNKVNVGEELADMLWYISNDMITCVRAKLVTKEALQEVIEFDLKQSYAVTNGGMLAASQGVFMWLHAVIYNASKLADTSKRYLAYGSSEREVKEYKQTLLYLLGAINNLAKDYRVDLEEAMDKNIAKLKQRYPDKFSEDKAVNRDVAKEQAILKGAGDDYPVIDIPAVSTDNDLRKYPLPLTDAQLAEMVANEPEVGRKESKEQPSIKVERGPSQAEGLE